MKEIAAIKSLQNQEDNFYKEIKPTFLYKIQRK